jgi:outer membrane biosynthesis protein TonB
MGAPGGPAAPADGGMAPPAPAEVAAVEPSAPPPAAEPAPEPAPEPAAAPPPPPAPEPAAAAPEPKAEPAPAPKPKAEAKPKPAPKAAAKPKSAAPKQAPAEAKVAWWPAKAAGKLNVVYAGEASFTKAIALMFDGQFDNADGANANIKVTPKKGGEVKGKWMVANGNKSMLLLNVDPGLYNVEIGSGLADKGGRAVSAASSGAVFVH